MSLKWVQSKYNNKITNAHTYFSPVQILDPTEKIFILDQPKVDTIINPLDEIIGWMSFPDKTYQICISSPRQLKANTISNIINRKSDVKMSVHHRKPCQLISTATVEKGCIIALWKYQLFIHYTWVRDENNVFIICWWWRQCVSKFIL